MQFILLNKKLNVDILFSSFKQININIVPTIDFRFIWLLRQLPRIQKIYEIVIYLPEVQVCRYICVKYQVNHWLGGSSNNLIILRVFRQNCWNSIGILFPGPVVSCDFIFLHHTHMHNKLTLRVCLYYIILADCTCCSCSLIPVVRSYIYWSLAYSSQVVSDSCFYQ